MQPIKTLFRMALLAILLPSVSGCFLHSKTQLIRTDESVNPFGVAKYVHLCIEVQGCFVYERFRDNDFRIYGSDTGEYARFKPHGTEGRSFIGSIGPSPDEGVVPRSYIIVGLSVIHQFGKGHGQVSFTEGRTVVESMSDAQAAILSAAFNGENEYLDFTDLRYVTKSEADIWLQDTQ